MSDQLPSGLRHQIVNAIQRIQQHIHWKEGKDKVHLATRIEYGHLPEAATLANYEAIIANILQQFSIWEWG